MNLLNPFLAGLLMFSVVFAEDSPSGKYADINDIRMYYEVHGEGEPLLLLHGGTGNGEVAWAELAPLLAPKYRLIIPDSRAQGRSTDSDQPLSYDLMTNDFHKLMDHLGIESAHVLGASDGGIIGLNLALRYPDRVGKVVAYGANFHPIGLTDRQRELIENLTPESYGDAAEANYLDVAPDPERFGILLEKICAMWLSQPVWTEADLSQITTPVLIIDDTAGLAIRAEHVRTMATAIPGARLAFIDDTDHFAHIDKPEEFSDLVLEFFAER